MPSRCLIRPQQVKDYFWHLLACWKHILLKSPKSIWICILCTSYQNQKLLTLGKHLSSAPVFGGVWPLASTRVHPQFLVGSDPWQVPEFIPSFWWGLTLGKHLSSSPVFGGVCVAHHFSFLCYVLFVFVLHLVCPILSVSLDGPLWLLLRFSQALIQCMCNHCAKFR